MDEKHAVFTSTVFLSKFKFSSEKFLWRCCAAKIFIFLFFYEREEREKKRLNEPLSQQHRRNGNG